MKGLRYISLIVFAIAQSLCGCAQKSDKLASVAFYNVENLFDTINDPLKNDDEFTPGGRNGYTDNIYRQKLHNLATVISGLGADTRYGPAFIGLAEVENDKVLKDLVAQPEIKEHNYQFIWFDGPDPRGIDVALLYDPRQFNPISLVSAAVDLVGTGDKELTRDILHVTGILANDTVHVLLNHWPSRREGKYDSAPKRTIAALANRKIIDSLLNSDPDCRIIVMGDMNDDPDDVSITTILKAGGKEKEVAEKELYNPWVRVFQHGEGTLGYHYKWNLFDQIIVSRAILNKTKNHISFTEAKIFAPEYIRQQYGKYKGFPLRGYSGNRWMNGFSDHFPVEVYLSIN